MASHRITPLNGWKPGRQAGSNREILLHSASIFDHFHVFLETSETKTARRTFGPSSKDT